MYILKRPLHSNYYEYEIQDSTHKVEQEFYKYFLEFMEKIKFDILEYQIIINPMRAIMEIRIRMKKLNTCFSKEFSLGMLEENGGRRGVAAFDYICESVTHTVREYVMSLCYKEEKDNG